MLIRRVCCLAEQLPHWPCRELIEAPSIRNALADVYPSSDVFAAVNAPEWQRNNQLQVCTGMLRNLSSYYFKDAPGLHLVRVAQGLLHAGKGLVTLSPHHADRTLLSPVSLASLLTVRSPSAAA